MQMPTVRVAESQAVLETHIRRLVRARFPQIDFSVQEDGEARRYILDHDGTLIVEIDTLPVSSEVEVRVARPRADDMGFCEVFYSWMGETYRSKAQFVSVVDRVTWPLPLVLNQQLFESWVDQGYDQSADEILMEAVAETARAMLPPVMELIQDPLEDAQREMVRFKSLVERQLHTDILDAARGRPRERFGRAVLQAFLPERGYREVGVRGGYSDLLLFVRQGRFLYETKIWHGQKYFHTGLGRLRDYIVGEEDDQGLLGVFYVVFDPTRTRRATRYREGAFSTEVVADHTVNVVMIDLLPADAANE